MSSKIEFTCGDLYEFEGMPGMSFEEPYQSETRVGQVIRIESVTVTGDLVVSVGTQSRGDYTDPGVRHSWHQAGLRVPLPTAVALIEQEVWLPTRVARPA